MMNKLCNWSESKNGQYVTGIAALVGGLHLMATEAQPVLGFLPAFSVDIMGRTIGAQQLVGAAVAVTGLGVVLCQLNGPSMMGL
ncbi:MAG: hypothetical protein CMA72_08415 [Euryarchaeota archaeon]|jgi:hypothetical protein|nr:hypothetical protein [Euryarchaeota archaeon]|tara:strand:+ start:5533 stop:5784 length:252 start_codon:yes stop_codon:yes gene_type:complete